jgi:hypothetical protein
MRVSFSFAAAVSVMMNYNGQGFLLCWYSLNVQPGTAADLKN